MTRELLDRLLAALAEHRTVVVASDVATGDEQLFDPFDPPPGLDPQVAAAAREAAGRDMAYKLERLGRGALFLRPYSPPVRVVIVGAAHVAQPLSRMVQLAGYDVLVVDPRRAFATEERFRGIPLLAEWPEEALSRVGLDRRSALVALTHDAKIDDPALAAALRSNAFYIGALGSRKTHAARLDRLRAMGFGDADLARIHAPIGLPIGAVSPGEIAVAILSEIVGCLRPRRE
jgi:xanthine dehydrogenase accessory factor